MDPETGDLIVLGGRRLSREEAQVLRQAIGEGRGVVFVDRHQWRHFQVRRV